MELVDGLKKVMGDEAERAIPGYNGQGLELAGFFWVHGEADAAWPSKAEAYEGHLANLIKDLRKDLATPKLPAVVVALADAKEPLRENPQKVFDAQLAVGNPEKHPEFQGNVVSIDTRTMIKPKEKNPGGRDRFLGNAESYLEIGDAMAEAMLQLLKK